jgi:predicted aminopeptidase
MELLSRTVPIDEALQDPALTDEQRDKLAFVTRVRDYAEHMIGLNVGTSYRTFVNLNGEALAWNLSASRKDAIQPHIWNLPVVGAISYLGFFERDEANAERDRLVEEGFDTMIYRVDAYSTLGWLPDPVSSSLLERELGSLADTIIHEALHNTIWHPSNVQFSESMAVFVGRAGAIEFLEMEFGAESAFVTEVKLAYEDDDRFDAFIAELIRKARQVYAGDLDYDTKLLRRQEIFDAEQQRFRDEVQPMMNFPENYDYFPDLNINNAYLLVNQRYNTSLAVFEGVHRMTGGNWTHTLDIFRDASRSTDPFLFLWNVLAQAEAGEE